MLLFKTIIINNYYICKTKSARTSLVVVSAL